MNLTKEILGLANRGQTLKRLMRTGWSLAGVDCARTESVGEHTYGTVLNALLISKALVERGEIIDLGKVAAMATIHDLPESLITDIPRTAVELQKAKQKAERVAMKRITETTQFFGGWLLDLWSDLEDGNSIEARIVLGADLIDMLVHAVSLEKSGVSPDILDQFFTNSHDLVQTLNLELVEGIFWELYNEHLENATRMGVSLTKIERK